MNHQINDLITWVNKLRDGYLIEFDNKGDADLLALSRSIFNMHKSSLNHLDQMVKIISITDKVSEDFTIKEALDDIYILMQDIIPYDRIGFALIDEKNRDVIRAYWSRSESDNIKIQDGYGGSLKNSSLKNIFKSGKPRILNDLERYMYDHPKSESTARIVEEGMRSSLTCPLVAMGEEVGFMFFSSMRKSTYKKAHVEVFSLIAKQLSLQLEKMRLYEKMVELNDLKDKFLGMAAHDLRNPLAVFIGYLDCLRDGLLGSVDERQMDTYNKMYRRAEGMADLINQFLDISTIEAGVITLEPDSVDFYSFIREHYEESCLIAQSSSISLKLDCHEDIGKAYIDANRIEQVFNNLVGNAIKFSEPNSEIRIFCRLIDGFIEVAVADDGPGMSEEDSSLIFDYFKQVKGANSRKGVGLGLAISSKIIGSSGGRIWVDTDLGKGSSFYFTVPISSV